MPRNIGTIPASTTNDDRILYWHLLRMDWDAVPTVYRWGTYPYADSIVIDVGDGDGDQTWDNLKVWTPGDYEQGQQSALAVSDLVFGNADNSFSDMLNARVNGSVKGVRFAVYEIHFDKDDPNTLLGLYRVFEGEGDREEVGNEVRVSLIPLKYPLLTKFPRRTFSPNHGFNWIPKPNITFPWGNAMAGAPPPPNTGSDTPTTPGDPGGNIGASHRMPIIPVSRDRGTPRTVTRGPGGGRTPRSVGR